MTDVKEVLSVVRRTNAEIALLQEERARIASQLAYVHATDYASDVGRGSGGRGSVETLAVKLADTDSVILAHIISLLCQQRKVRQLIDRLPDARWRELLHRRYIAGASWAQIAADMHYSYRHVIRMHGIALEALRKMS